MPRTRNRKIYSKFLYLVLTIGVIFLCFYLPGRFIKIKKVVCESQYGECVDSIKSEINNWSQLSLLESKKNLAKLFGNNPLISDYSLQFEFPDKLKANILVKKPRYAIFNKNTGRYLLLGGTGEVLDVSDNSSLPTVIQYDDNPNLLALSLMEGVFAMYQVQKGEMIENSLVVELPTGVRVIFPLDGQKDKDILLGSLRLIYSQVTDKMIDLRYKNALLR